LDTTTRKQTNKKQQYYDALIVTYLYTELLI